MRRLMIAACSLALDCFCRSLFTFYIPPYSVRIFASCILAWFGRMPPICSCNLSLGLGETSRLAMVETFEILAAARACRTCRQTMDQWIVRRARLLSQKHAAIFAIMVTAVVCSDSDRWWWGRGYSCQLASADVCRFQKGCCGRARVPERACKATPGRWRLRRPTCSAALVRSGCWPVRSGCWPMRSTSACAAQSVGASGHTSERLGG